MRASGSSYGLFAWALVGSVFGGSSLGACGGSDARIDGVDGGGSVDGTPSTTACRFTLRAGETRRVWEGSARARMNGRGNLLVTCVGTGAAAGSTAELHFGNASFDGPRTYVGDDFSRDGSFLFEDGEARYRSNDDGGACSLVLTEAPVDGFGNAVPVGASIRASFTCAAIVDDEASPPRHAVDDGALTAVVE